MQPSEGECQRGAVDIGEDHIPSVSEVEAMKVLEKRQLESLLLGWQAGKLSPQEVHEEAEELMGRCEWRDLPKTEPDSVMYEVLCQLDILNQQLIVSDDVPAMLKFLRSSPSELNSAWNEWECEFTAV